MVVWSEAKSDQNKRMPQLLVPMVALDGNKISKKRTTISLKVR
jgi:hypothetical protein